MGLFTRETPFHAVLGGDTITSVPHNPSPLRLGGEDTSARRLHDEPPAKQFKVRIADSEGRRISAKHLIQRRFGWRGYKVDEQGLDAASRITIAAHDRNGTAGTLSVGLDTDRGLSVDDLYAGEVAVLRREGARLCEFTKLAVDNDVRSMPVVAALFHVAFIYARRIHECTDLLIEVNPRHVGFYRRMLGFEQFGPERLNGRVEAPAVLMRLRLAHAEAEIARYGGRVHLAASVRSLYPFAFSPREETAIERRLREFG